MRWNFRSQERRKKRSRIRIMNNLEKNSKIEIRTDGRKSYDIILKDSFRKFLISSAKQLTIFGEDRGVKICLLILFAEKTSTHFLQRELH